MAAPPGAAEQRDPDPEAATPARPLVRALRAAPRAAPHEGLRASAAAPAARNSGAAGHPDAQHAAPDAAVVPTLPGAGARAVPAPTAGAHEIAPAAATRSAPRGATQPAAHAPQATTPRQPPPGAGRRDELSALLADLEPALAEPRLRPAALAIASTVAWRLGFERVSIGVPHGGAVRLAAVSDAPDLAPRAPLARALEAAMSEAARHGLPVRIAARDPGAPHHHRALAAESGARHVHSVPLRHGDRLCGVLLCERLRDEAPQPETLRACEALAGVLGPVLELKRRDAAGGWLRRMRRPLLGLLALLGASATLALVEADYRVSAPARVEGRVQRVLVAPFDGYVDTAEARAGDRVVAGQVLATLQRSALVLERDTRGAEREEFEKQYRRAMAGRDWAEARVLEARMAQAQARVDLLDARLARTRIVAPFDGVLLSGDLERSLGAPVERGQVLFELAPLDGQRVVLQADERDVGTLAPGMRGTLTLAALPDAAIPLTVEQVSGAARSEAGRALFLVEARLDGDTRALRPGMEGVAKVTVEPRPLLWIVTHRLVEWLGLTLWTWLP